MSDRSLKIAFFVTAIAVLAAQATFKAWPSAEDIKRNAQGFSEPQDWQGRVAPDFELPLRDGSTFRLSDAVGRQTIVLNFFATWCPPCVKEMPELQRYHALHVEEGLVLIGIDAEEKPSTVDAFLEKHGLTFPVGVDASGAILRAYDVTSFPTTIVIGADGRVKLRETGAIMNADVALDGVVRPELASISAGRSIAKDAYLAALKTAPPPARRHSDSHLDPRAQTIADAMPCPCGCEDKVAECGCRTAKGIKARLAQGRFDSRTDAEVIQELNREFCMKGM